VPERPVLKQAHATPIAFRHTSSEEAAPQHGGVDRQTYPMVPTDKGGIWRLQDAGEAHIVDPFDFLDRNVVGEQKVSYPDLLIGENYADERASCCAKCSEHR